MVTPAWNSNACKVEAVKLIIGVCLGYVDSQFKLPSMTLSQRTDENTDYKTQSLIVSLVFFKASISRPFGVLEF